MILGSTVTRTWFIGNEMGCGSVPGKPVPQGAAGGFASAGIPRAHSKRLGNLPLIHGELVSAHKTDVFQVTADGVNDPP